MTVPEGHKFDSEFVDRIQSSPRVSDVVYRALREAVISRKIAPGERLREEPLAHELGVSRTSIRDALRRLIADGLAVQEPYKGVKAIEVPVDEMVQVLSLRALLEGRALELAAGRISRQDLQRMRELLPKSVEPLTFDNPNETRRCNREFHWIAIRACGERHLIHLLEYLWNLAPTDMLVSRLTEEERLSLRDADLSSHTQLLKVLEAGDGRRAREINERHMHPAMKRLEQAGTSEIRGTDNSGSLP